MTMYPSGYGTTERTLDDLMDRHCPPSVTEPEFRRRLRHFLQSKNGLIGIGDFLPRSRGNNVSAASAANRSFHQLQRFSDGSEWASAVDLVVRRPGGLGHSSGAVPWHEVPKQGSRYAAEWGVHMNIGNESWHIQAIEQDGFATFVAQGRPRPAPGFPLPCTEPAPPPLVFDPAAGRFGLWPVHPSKPLLSTEAFAIARRERADSRWVWTGDAVRYAQAVVGAKVDGWFGQQTKAAVEQFQLGARVTVDGLIGAKTWALIDRQAA